MQHRIKPMRECFWIALMGWLLLIGAVAAQVAESTGNHTLPIDQLEVNKTALRAGSDNAARLMLTSDDPLTREELLALLANPAETRAHVAVCRAMETLHTEGYEIWHKQDLVNPMLSLLSDPNTPSSSHVAEALLLYDYQTIGSQLEVMAHDPNLPESVRLNSLQALRLQPNKQAVLTIFALADDPVEAVAEQAQEILDGFGIDAADRARVATELENRNMDEFLWGWLIQQEAKMRELRAEGLFWQDLTLKSLNRLYAALVKDEERGKLLVDNLQASQPARKIWAVEKVRRWRLNPRPASGPLPTELTPVLATLLSDPSDEVRMEVADLLALCPQIEYVNPLLAQLEKEPLEPIKLKLFEALGFTLSGLELESRATLPEHVRKRTLEWASHFLNQENPEAVRKGAVVLCRLLEKNDLESDYARQSLQLLVQRLEHLSPDSPLKADLLTQMVLLCDETSGARAQAMDLYRPAFIEALKDPMVAVREQGMEGLIRIDAATAFERFKEDMINDPSPKLRARVISLAESRARSEDLQWLVERAASGEDREVAAQSITAILTNADWDVLSSGITPLMQNPAALGLSEVQWQSILQHAYELAESEEDTIKLHTFGAELLRLHLVAGRIDAAAELLVAALKDSDLDPKGGYAVNLGRFFNDPDRSAVAQSLIQAVNPKLDPGAVRQHWQRWVQSVMPSTPEVEKPVTPEGASTSTQDSNTPSGVAD